MDRFGIIQLSDLQFGAKHRFGIDSNLNTSLSEDILELSQVHKFTPIYLILSGDITETGNLNEFTQASTCIKKICNDLQIDRESVLAIPGNHDINWKLSEISQDVGDPMLKYSNYNKFVIECCNKQSLVKSNIYQVFSDIRLGIQFLLLNSCEKEDHLNHFGFVEKQKLIDTLKVTPKNEGKVTKICIVHHRIEQNDFTSKSSISNPYDIETILVENEFKIILSGHIHEQRFFEVKYDGKSIIHSGAGSAGVDSSQRRDGIPNQYSIHVLDSFNKKLETIWRAYSPLKRTKFGVGGWTKENSIEVNPSIFELPEIESFDSISTSSNEDAGLIHKYKIKSNPFTFSNAEKIHAHQIINLFVSTEGRNKSGVRLSGDAIIRGRRGSGKTMLLRYLQIFGELTFDENMKCKRVSESFPVMVNLSSIHNSEWKTQVISLIDTAEKLIYESVLNALEKKNEQLNSNEFRKSLHHLKEKLHILRNTEGSNISKLGIAIRQCMSGYFSHILLLIDEVAPVFPKEFFADANNGFLRWMNSIRNSGPYFTRIAVYPNDVADILNEDRFGSIVNLDFDIKSNDDYLSFRKYCIELVNKYLKGVSSSILDPTKITDIIFIEENSSDDSLEQLIYASDGSSRRFISLFDKCITSPHHKEGTIFDKDNVFNVIKEFSSNLLSSYDPSEKELAQSIAKACKKQITNRFRLPGLSSLLLPLHAKSEELNIVKLTEIGRGTRGTTYEFTYPYCLLMEIQTHVLKDTRKVCSSRDNVTGDWITQVTTINKDQLEYLNYELRIEGIITEIDSTAAIITDFNNNVYFTESLDDDFKVGSLVSFIHINTIASDLHLLK